LKRDLENTRGSGLQLTTSFTADEIKIYRADTGGTNRISYSSIISFVETAHTYTLFTKADQFIVVNKTSLAQAKKKKDFVMFIQEQCKNAKWRK